MFTKQFQLYGHMVLLYRARRLKMNSVGGVTVFVSEDIIKNAPSCQHGPTVIFERISSDTKKRFYACASNRDRKLCNFYQLISENDEPVRQKASSAAKLQAKAKKISNLKTFAKRLKAFKALPESQRHFCRTCGEPLLPKEAEEKSNHANHDIINGVSDEELLQPLSLLDPVTDNKSDAQYYFDDQTINTTMNILRAKMTTHVLCIGTPSLFEKLKATKDIHCFLLDIDSRLVRLLPQDSSARYNMFTHHFFDGSAGRNSYLEFLRSGHQADATGSKFMIIMDPPFGGLVDLIYFTLQMISKDFFDASYKDQLVNTFLIFPCYLEDKICRENEFKMADFEVTYRNHRKLKKRKREEDGQDEGQSSVVRIFTNVELSTIVLPKKLGYKFCKPCNKYVRSVNKHCSKCNSCTTKVGRTYHHCDLCKRCVKPTWLHCNKCGICELTGRHSKPGPKIQE